MDKAIEKLRESREQEDKGIGALWLLVQEVLQILELCFEKESNTPQMKAFLENGGYDKIAPLIQKVKFDLVLNQKEELAESKLLEQQTQLPQSNSQILLVF